MSIFNIDGYKLDHRRQYGKGVENVYSNWTARSSRIKEIDKVVFLGLQAAIKRRLMEDFEPFFFGNIDEICNEYEQFCSDYLGPNSIGSDHIRALYNLGYLPLRFKALPEGTQVPLRVPMFTVENTHPDFFWLTNYFETMLSAELWLPCTSATLAMRIRTMLDGWADKTGGNKGFVPFQGHDFSMRGMGSVDSAKTSGMGHLVAFSGTDTIPAIQFIQKYYKTKNMPGFSVAATEHSVMSAGSKESELETFDRLLDLYPEGIVSIVSDTWDYWSVLTKILPTLKNKIMARNGKVVCRPDSGDPADIICGVNTRLDGQDLSTYTVEQQKGSIQLLWELFGGTTNEKGYKTLDPHIGLIYGDSMNYERINEICQRLESKGFSSDNVCFGIGSFSYQYQTRDVFGFAMKATNVTINGIETPIFKDPKTDNGVKKSAFGRVKVIRKNGELMLVDQSNELFDSVSEQDDMLKTVWLDGGFVNEIGFDEVRRNALETA
jgi:nicotinamide phosphoribosyltransferase